MNSTGSASLLTLAALALALPAAGADLKCEDITPRIKSLDIMSMQPLRRGKTWLPGRPQTIFHTACDPRGMKSEEAEYSRNSLVRKNRFVSKSRGEAKQICESRRSEAKLATSFSEETSAAMDDFCRENRKKDFDAVFVFDSAQGAAPERPVRRIFRLYNAAGFPAEEYEFGDAADLETRTVYEYDPGNDLVRKTDYAPDGGQLKREAYSSDKAAASRTISFLDENDQLKKRITREYRADGTLRRETIRTYETGEEELGRTERYCDTKGVSERELVFQRDLTKPVNEYRYSHKFDRRGNWTEERKSKATIYDGKRFEDPKTAPQITRRKITYY
jgi:hypothetical protein